jgi:hypothetical protein
MTQGHLIGCGPHRVVRAHDGSRDKPCYQVGPGRDRFLTAVQGQDFRSPPDCAKRPVLKASAIRLEVYP